MPLPRKEFYMIRHGQSVANRDQYFSGNLDVALTEKGKQQASLAGKILDKLSTPPRLIIHSHLSRARDTAAIMNQNLKLPMQESALIGEHHFGDWEKKPWGDIRPRFYAGENPPNGETHKAFHARIQQGLTHAIHQSPSPVLIVCHGGVFRAFHCLYNAPFEKTENAKLYHFKPSQSTTDFPWEIKLIE
jgi:broad specificity phosphatase PhoE